MITPALKALYAGNTTFRALETLQLSHISWANDFWIVNDVYNWNFTLEDGNPQGFIALPFELKLPNKDTGGNQELQISICNIGMELMQLLEVAALFPAAIDVTLRIFLDIPNSFPQNDPPMVLAISEVDADMQNVTATATRYDVINRPFPSRIYTMKEFPGLDR